MLSEKILTGWRRLAGAGVKGAAANMKRRIPACHLEIFKARNFHAIFLVALMLTLADAPRSSAQNPFAGIEGEIKQKAAETALTNLLNDQLPLKLDANATYPTVNTLPGGPFTPQPLTLTAADLDKPLPPGDYAIPMLAFCTEYSVHQPGHGVAYRLGPMEGKAAQAIAALQWRGTLLKGISPQQLIAVSWTIQSGLTYAQMPKTYQAIIDNVIPDYKSELNGDFVASLEGTYSGLAKQSKLPPLDQMLAKLGKPGELALSAERQRAILLQQNTSDQVKEQTLFEGQESGVYTPVKTEDGPWTERIPGVAYLRFVINGGNMARDNIMQVRILPQAGNAAARTANPHLVYANYIDAAQSPSYVPVGLFEKKSPPPTAPTPTSPTPTNLVQGSIACAVGRGAQCLGPVPALSAQPATTPANAVAKVTEILGKVTITHNGVTKPLSVNDLIAMGDQISTGPKSHVDLLFADNTEFLLAENTKLTIDDYVYDPNSHSGSAAYRWLEGAFQYISGLLTKQKDPNVNIETPAGTLGIRGTQFLASFDAKTGKAEIDLIEGAIDFTPKQGGGQMSFTAPVRLTSDGAGISTAPLTQQQYNTLKSQLLPTPTS